MSETTIDWRAIIEQVLLYLSGAGLLTWGGWKGWLKLQTGGTVEPLQNSDKPAPDGFVEHAALIVATAPAATPAIRESYMLDGLTEAQVLRAECQRLAPAKTTTTKLASGWAGVAESGKPAAKRRAAK
jgi:hypothetical protein